MKIETWNLLPICGDNDGGTGGDNGGGTGGDNGGGNPPAPKTFTQDDVNAILAKERRETQKKIDELRKVAMSNDSAQLKQQLDEVQKSYRTKEEQHAYEKKLLEEQSQQKLEALTNENKTLKERYQSTVVDYTLTEAISSADAFNPVILRDFLKNKTEVKQTENGNLDLVVKLAVPTDKGEVTLELKPKEAIKKMQEMNQVYGMFFKSNIKTGNAPSSGGPAKFDPKSVTSIKDYDKLKAEGKI